MPGVRKFCRRPAISYDSIAYICDINEKKGIELVVQAFHELSKINSKIRLDHIGRNQDVRRWYYLESIMPHLNTAWYNHGYANSHHFVKEFLKDRGWIICSSIAEGHPMNIIEACATGCIPLIHAYPGADIQWPSEYIWANFDQLKAIYTDKHDPKKVRDFIVDKYDYRKSYKPVLEGMEAKA